jgi:hypothetical protein
MEELLVPHNKSLINKELLEQYRLVFFEKKQEPKSTGFIRMSATKCGYNMLHNCYKFCMPSEKKANIQIWTLFFRHKPCPWLFEPQTLLSGGGDPAPGRNSL